MNEKRQFLRLELNAEPDSVTRARHSFQALAGELGLDAQVLDRIAIAVSEAVGDAVRRHSGEEAGIEITALRQPDSVEVIVKDGAIDLEADDLARLLIDDATDSYEVEPLPDGGIEVKLHFGAH